jgi:pimeloyl-ACP methyl ester carboxylesterase
MNELSDLRRQASFPFEASRLEIPDQALVFIHGIFSSHATFKPLVKGLLASAPALAQYGRYYFDYDFQQSIPTNGRELADALRRAFPERKPQVTLVGHSMGGLVARTALLQAGDLDMVKRLVMLGTPNHGTLQTARLGFLAHLTREATAKLWPVFARRATGIKELTEIGKIIEPLLADGVERTRRVEYVTIPGLRFHQESGWLDAPPGTSAGLRKLTILFSLLQAGPGMKVELNLPHDGIVEERSVRLSSDETLFSERPKIQPPYAPYLHVTHPDYHRVDHITVHQAERTIALLAELLLTPDLGTWRQSLAARGQFNLFPA